MLKFAKKPAPVDRIGVWVSMFNQYSPCADHHFAGMTRLLGDQARARGLGAALEADDMAQLNPMETAALAYGRRLTLTPGDMRERDVKALRAGFDGGEVPETNQVAAHFSHASRTGPGRALRDHR